MESVLMNSRRIADMLNTLSRFGSDESHKGINRPFGSKPDQEARNWLCGLWAHELKLSVHVDPIANLWGEYPGAKNIPAIAIGSHHDTVTNGGSYDGAIGVILATELVRRLSEEKIVLRHPIYIVSFSGEEPNEFNISTLGSKVATEKLKKEQLTDLKNDDDTVFFKDVLSRLGGNVDKVSEAVISPKKISAFLECHNEQGRRLADHDLSVAVVTRIIGLYREKIYVVGEANHSGATYMCDRHDALPAASELVLALESIVKGCNDKETVGTVGFLKVFPNSTNIIPATVELILEVRTVKEDLKQQILDKVSAACADIIEKRSVKIERTVILNQNPKDMNTDVIASVRKGIEKTGEEYLSLVSMAGHDAGNVSDIIKTGMLFVRSEGGRSHCSEEYSRIEDICKAGNALFQTVLELDKRFDV